MPGRPHTWTPAAAAVVNVGERSVLLLKVSLFILVSFFLTRFSSIRDMKPTGAPFLQNIRILLLDLVVETVKQSRPLNVQVVLGGFYSEPEQPSVNERSYLFSITRSRSRSCWRPSFYFDFCWTEMITKSVQKNPADGIHFIQAGR